MYIAYIKNFEYESFLFFTVYVYKLILHVTKKIELERQQLSEKAEIYRQAVVRSVGDVQELGNKL